MPLNSDFKDLLRAFNDKNAEYLLIGGYAVMFYTEPRYTKDLDLWVRASPKNAKRVYSALREFGAPLSGLSEGDFTEEGYYYQMGVPPVRVDIFMSVPGLEFDQAWPRRKQIDFDGVPVNLISKPDLVTVKRASGRHIDLHDVDQLLHSEQ